MENIHKLFRSQRNEIKKGSKVKISSLSNFYIRIVDIVTIQWVRSIYFFLFSFLIFPRDLIYTLEKRTMKFVHLRGNLSF